MGVKSTVQLSRKAAEMMAVQYITEAYLKDVEEYVRSLSDQHIEDFLEQKNDEKYENGYGFDNYAIVYGEVS